MNGEKGPEIKPEHYTEMIGYSLMYFQLIEQALRDYLNGKEKKYSRKDSLGILVAKFKEIHPTDPLGNKLDAINEKRIRIAHNIWLETMKVNEEILRVARKDINKVLQDYFSDKVKELMDIQQQSNECLIELIYKVRSLKP
jgi:hypothetical protein